MTDELELEVLARGTATLWGEAVLGRAGRELAETWRVAYGSSPRGEATLALVEALGPPVDLQLAQMKLPLASGVSMELEVITDADPWPLVQVAPGTHVTVEVRWPLVDDPLAVMEVVAAGLGWREHGAGIVLPVERALLRPLVS